MNKLSLLSCAFVLASVGLAHADSNAISGSNSGARASSGAVSGSSIVTNNIIPSNTSSHVSGSVYGTPSVPQAAYFAGTNPCLVGVGAGGSGGPIGLSIAFGHNDPGCTRRSDAAAWHALGMDDVAVARMLQDDDNAAAYKAAGRGVTPVAVVTPAPVVEAAPAPVKVVSSRLQGIYLY
jgi:hypothetical protein